MNIGFMIKNCNEVSLFVMFGGDISEKLLYSYKRLQLLFASKVFSISYP